MNYTYAKKDSEKNPIFVSDVEKFRASSHKIQVLKVGSCGSQVGLRNFKNEPGVGLRKTGEF